MRARMIQQRDELLDAPSFAVYGLAVPALHPFALADYRRDDAGWDFLTLAYGDRTALAGPFVSVTTAAPHEHPRRRHLDESLRQALSAERDRGRIDSGVELPAEPGEPRLFDARVRVDGEPERMRCCADDDLWVARLTRRSQLDLVVAVRGVRPTNLRLVVVDDLAPYWHGREELYGCPFGT